jgi:outer membrane protein
MMGTRHYFVPDTMELGRDSTHGRQTGDTLSHAHTRSGGPPAPFSARRTRIGPAKNPLMTSRIVLAALLAAYLAPARATDLMQIYQLAVERDPRTREAEERRNAALENRPQGIARLLPTLSMSGRLNRDSVEAKFKSAELVFLTGGRNIGFWNSTASVDLVQPIYHHESWVQLSQADNQIAEAEANYAAEQQNLIRRTADAYFNVLLAQDTLEFARAEQEAIARQLEQAQARFEVGLTPVTDVHEAQAGFDRARAGTIVAENQLDNAKEALREIVGEYPGDLDGLAAELPLNPPQPDALAQKENLTIIASQNRTEFSKKNIDLQFAGHMPTLDLRASAGFTDTNRPFGIRTEYERIGMEVNVPMFSGGGVNSRVRQARHDFEAAMESLDGRRRAVTRQVKEAYRGVVSSISQVKALQSAVVSAESALEATLAGFDVGTRTMVEVLTEQRNRFGTKRDYSEARYNYIRNSLSLKQAASTLMPEDLALVNHWLHGNKSAMTAAETKARGNAGKP